MHLQSIKKITIPLVENIKNTDQVARIRSFPIFNTASRNPNPLTLIERTLERDSHDSATLWNRQNTVSNDNRVKGVILLKGHNDVDLVYRVYIKYPHWFDGSSEEAFHNRESVMNLTLNLLSEDWYSLLKNESIKEDSIGLPQLKMFSDVLKEIGIVRFPGDKPRHSLFFHRYSIQDYLAETTVNSEYKNDLIPLYFAEAHGDFDSWVMGERNPLNTLNFIRACLQHGGISYLIEVLNCLYGSVIIAKKNGG